MRFKPADIVGLELNPYLAVSAFVVLDRLRQLDNHFVSYLEVDNGPDWLKTSHGENTITFSGQPNKLLILLEKESEYEALGGVEGAEEKIFLFFNS